MVVGDTLRNVRKKKIWDRTIGTGITGEKVKKMQLYNKVTIHSVIVAIISQFRQEGIDEKHEQSTVVYKKNVDYFRNNKWYFFKFLFFNDVKK